MSTVTGPAAGWTVAVAGSSLHLPGTDPAAGVPGLRTCPDPRADPACPPEEAHELLGRKGLLGKDAATRLALCAVHRALGLPPGRRPPPGPPDPAVAVVASSNLGNLATVAGVVRAVRSGQRKEISPLMAPGASSNVLASAVAIWFGFGGPCVMLCSGATSGIDAVTAGALLLRSGRAARVVVVGAEPADEVAAALHARRAPRAAALREGAACVILQQPGRAAGPLLGPVASLPGEPPGGPPPAVVVGPAQAAGPGGECIDLAACWGDLYGAHGIAQTVVAAAIASVRRPAGPVRVVCGDPADGWRRLDVRPARRAC
jgi:3-oxoacyl-[acyl-carrier-protein] synthase II